MLCNRLKLNADKTELIFVAWHTPTASEGQPDAAGDRRSIILPLQKVGDLGVINDGELTMEPRVAYVVRNSFYQLRAVQRSLTFDARRTLDTAFIANRIDYCNSVLYGATTHVIRRLQTVIWNSLPEYLRLPSTSKEQFRCGLKPSFFNEP